MFHHFFISFQTQTFLHHWKILQTRSNSIHRNCSVHFWVSTEIYSSFQLLFIEGRLECLQSECLGDNLKLPWLLIRCIMYMCSIGGLQLKIVFVHWLHRKHWFLTGSTGSSQEALVPRRRHWFLTGSTGSSQKALVPHRKHWFLAGSTGSSQEALVPHRKHWFLVGMAQLRSEDAQVLPGNYSGRMKWRWDQDHSSLSIRFFYLKFWIFNLLDS